MRMVCSYCKKDMGVKDPLDDSSISHGICTECLEHFSRQWAGLSLGEYLDDIDKPVLVVNAEGRAIAANQPMADMLGKSEREIYGLLGGDVMECRFARLPGGCGETVHCEACTIRLNVAAAVETGQPQIKVPAYLETDNGRVYMTISTYPEGQIVKVVIDEVEDGQS